MKYRKLGHTNIDVSLICLGTMTWGEQNTEAEAFKQLDTAIAAGINFIDTAELYPVPPIAKTYTLTEQYLGNWLKKCGKRDDLVIATKIAGRSDWLPHIRNGQTCFDRKNIEDALNGSLKRLQTDYIDLYQLHWPDRKTNFFGQLGYEQIQEEVTVPIEETLHLLDEQVRAGKIRYIGLSNETPWGVMEFLRLAEQFNLPRVVSIQNPYNLLNRSFEIGLAEVSHREHCGLLAYSPLGFGVLSGKYLGGNKPEKARITLFERFSRYNNPESVRATQEYINLAREHDLDPAQMALAYVNSRPFLTSTIIGATTIEQLESNLASADIELAEEVIDGINAIHRRQPNPAP
ncbi:MAG: NADP(H)-dependent aldo-keto reductase [Gammaproteobacteria bacterium]|nr:NADP(H)-dependent aldo-keto reductase [Gammaproteobacteria bacterium]